MRFCARRKCSHVEVARFERLDNIDVLSKVQQVEILQVPLPDVSAHSRIIDYSCTRLVIVLLIGTHTVRAKNSRYVLFHLYLCLLVFCSYFISVFSYNYSGVSSLYGAGRVIKKKFSEEG